MVATGGKRFTCWVWIVLLLSQLVCVAAVHFTDALGNSIFLKDVQVKGIVTANNVSAPNVDSNTNNIKMLLDLVNDLQFKVMQVEQNTAAQALQLSQGQSAMKTSFTQWGKSTCSGPNATLIYSGIVGGGHRTNGGAWYTCLTDTPEWLLYSDSDDSLGRGQMWVTEYATDYAGLGFDSKHGGDVVCSACLVHGASTMIMIPGATSCPVHWSVQYRGYLMGEHYSQQPKGNLCVEETLEVRPGGEALTSESHLYFMEGVGNLAYPVLLRELACVVCTR